MYPDDFDPPASGCFPTPAMLAAERRAEALADHARAAEAFAQAHDALLSAVPELDPDPDAPADDLRDAAARLREATAALINLAAAPPARPTMDRAA